MSFEEKVAIVTGAGSGIGRATALAFAASRAAGILVVDRDEDAGAQTASMIEKEGGRALFVSVDVSQEADVAKYVDVAVRSFGRIDCLFNNAAIEGQVKATWEYDYGIFQKVLAVNVSGVFLGMRHVLPVMIAQRSGRIVNASSVGGLVAAPGMSAYVASKHAVLGLTKTAAVEAGQFGVRVNAICPGTVETDMIRRIDAQRWRGETDPMRDFYATMTPTRRNNQPADIAQIVLFLCSDESGNINGVHITSDGGRGSGLSPWIVDSSPQ